MLKKLKSILLQKSQSLYPKWDISVALRYLPIAREIKHTFSSKPSILEIGSGEYGILPYLGKGYQVTGVDVDFGNASQKNMKMIKFSGEKLPFPAKSFSVVICVDTLEHVDEATRKHMIDEMVRVSRSQIYLAYPRGKAAFMSDRLLFRYYNFTHKQQSNYLNEHAHYGLPSDKNISSYIHESLLRHSRTASISCFGNTNFLLWLFMLMLGFSENAWLTSVYKILPLVSPLLSKINFPPAYRAIWILKFQ
ncbi:MAG: hypothetical protein UX80_C0002G0006 [Candidatus Amesbacteria bacterium GW2011_GWA2_47_11b]|uniref:Methyltransferase type 11 domain-containing protein n=3 Tax=Candidatus Amesiibacteriota TaxID=1752730 RepID=A0A0G1VJN1_9BACT|nr:MAG: hypothetical protein UX42_C0001G0122 [Microgenomates group bacterium GW2011_GWC1_46_20]KKU58471.1 MAG: hypothetical protein UX80_C0002G0006 [Candidatus Amesbacteria bacterium GW2011_GWA2_47_11b]KKU70280.1 MAG: hypothetical protein UX92_C0002G0024 [Candidatus Amesbacteria bacterium GW2011_GWA1_47_20]KKU84899.1 MAG: hypothetical protein UY11_C0001G0005 [Candidatus Amesbacteria bacterium GW2011_GWC2_47_8]